MSLKAQVVVVWAVAFAAAGLIMQSAGGELWFSCLMPANCFATFILGVLVGTDAERCDAMHKKEIGK